MNTLKAAIIIVAIISVAGVIGFYLYLENSRYEITTSEKGIAYQLDKKTGNTWMLRGEAKIPQTQPKPKKDAKHVPSPLAQKIIDNMEPIKGGNVLPLHQQKKITGRASLSNGGYFNGSIFNGSNWAVSQFKI